MSQTNEMLTLFGFSIPSAIMPAFALLTENQSIGDCVATQRSFVDGYTQITASRPVSGLQYATLKVSGIFLSSAAPSAATMVAIKFDLPPLWPSRLLFNIPGFDLRQPAAAVSQGGASEGATFNLSGVDFSLENAALILCTIGYTDPVTQVTVQPGFHLVGSWIPSDTIGLLNNLLNVNVRNPLPVGFQIYLPDSLNQNVPIPPPSQQGFTWEEAPLAPGVHLNANLYPLTKGQLPVNILSTGINLDNVRLRLYAPPTAQWAGHNPLYWPIMAATADLTISPQKNKASITATVTALNITAADSLCLFVKFHSGTSIQSPNDLFPWVGVDLLLPPSIMPTNLTFTLNEAEIQLASDSSSGGLSIGSVGFSASFDAGATISFLDGLLSLPPALTVYFTVPNPLNAPNSQSIYVSLGAQVNFKGIPFDIIVDWQQEGDLYSAYGELMRDAKIPLATIIGSYLPAAASCHIPDLTFENIRLRIGSDGSFGISAIVEGETGWTMPWQRSGESSGATQKNTAYMWATIENSANGQTTGNLGGSLYLADGTQIYVDYAFDGQNILQMALYSIKLSELLQTQLSVPVCTFGNSAIDYSFVVNEATLLFNLETNAYTVSAATGTSIAISLPGGGGYHCRYLLQPQLRRYKKLFILSV